MPKNPLPPNPETDADTEGRVRELQKRVEELAGEMSFDESPDMPEHLREAFWQQVLAIEEGEWMEPFDLLVQGGLDLPEPQTLDDAQLPAKLWELLRGMAMARMFLYHTDHLSDRELYAMLWHDLLRDPGPVMPLDNDSAWHIDVLGSGSAEDNDLYMRYYADAEERRRWAEDWPEDALPPAEMPAHNRDRHLPARDDPQWQSQGRLS